MPTKLRMAAVAAAFAMAFPLSSFATETELGRTVQSLLDYARQRNPELSTMQYDAVAARERAEAAGALPDPKVRIEMEDITRMGEQSPSLSPSRVGRTRYQLMQELPWFGKRDLQKEIALFDADSADGRANATWTDLAAKIKSAHAQLYYIHQSERLTREILDLMVRLERVTLSRYSAGLTAQSDVIRSQVEQTNLRNELVALEGEKQMAHARLNMLLGRPATAPLTPPDVLRDVPPPAKLAAEALQDRVRGRNPTLLAEEAKIRSAEKSRQLTYKNRYPDFAVGFAPVQYRNSVKEWELMVEVNIPLQQGSRRAQEREAEAMLSAARTRKEAAENEALAALNESLAGLQAAQRTERTIVDSLLPQAELTYQAATASYENGKVDFATLLDAQRQIRMAKQSRLKAQTDAQTRLAEIEKMLGEEL